MNQRAINYYDLLGVEPSATSAEIKAAYRARVATYHPDRNHTVHAGAVTALINEAYEILRDPAKRAAYDATMEPAPPASSENADRTPPQAPRTGHQTPPSTGPAVGTAHPFAAQASQHTEQASQSNVSTVVGVGAVALLIAAMFAASATSVVQSPPAGPRPADEMPSGPATSRSATSAPAPASNRLTGTAQQQASQIESDTAPTSAENQATLVDDPRNHDVFERARLAALEGRFNEAARLFDCVLRDNPTDRSALHNAGAVWLSLHDESHAAGYFLSYLDIATPDDPMTTATKKWLSEYTGPVIEATPALNLLNNPGECP